MNDNTDDLKNELKIVETFYEILKRAPMEDEKQYWSKRKDDFFNELKEKLHNEFKIEEQIRNAYMEILKRELDLVGLRTYKEKIITENKTIEWLKDILKNSREVKRFKNE